MPQPATTIAGCDFLFQFLPYHLLTKLPFSAFQWLLQSLCDSCNYGLKYRHPNIPRNHPLPLNMSLESETQRPALLLPNLKKSVDNKAAKLNIDQWKLNSSILCTAKYYISKRSEASLAWSRATVIIAMRSRTELIKLQGRNYISSKPLY